MRDYSCHTVNPIINAFLKKVRIIPLMLKVLINNFSIGTIPGLSFFLYILPGLLRAGGVWGGGGGTLKFIYFVDFFWGRHKIGLYLGVISMHFRVFSRARYRMEDYFWGC